MSSFDWFHDKDAKIYVHCTVKVCHSSLGDCSLNCDPDPAYRWRRSMSLFNENDEETVNIGPIYLGEHNPFI